MFTSGGSKGVQGTRPLTTEFVFVLRHFNAFQTLIQGAEAAVLFMQFYFCLNKFCKPEDILKTFSEH